MRYYAKYAAVHGFAQITELSVKIEYRNVSCLTGKWTLDWSQWQVKPNLLGTSPIGGIVGGELNIDDNGSVTIDYTFSYFSSTSNRAKYLMHCQGSLNENENLIEPKFGSITSYGNLKELRNQYEELRSDPDFLIVSLTLCGRGHAKNTNQPTELPFQVKSQTRANNRVIVIENHEIKSVWYQKK